MADIRINALATTATTPASDDYLALDGAAQGTRKILATNIANNVTDVILGTSGPSVKSTLSARAPRQGLVFDGTNGSTLPATVSFGSGDLTFCAWLNLQSLPAVAASTLNGGSGAFFCAIDSAGKFWAGVNSGTELSKSTNAISTGKFFLLSVVKSSGTTSYYINGVLDSSRSDSNTYSASQYIGSDNANNFRFTGTIIPLAYNRALSASEVVALYEAGAPSGADYPATAAGVALNTSAWTADPAVTFTSTSGDNISITATSSAGYAYTAPVFAIKTGQTIRLSGSFTNIAGNPRIQLLEGGNVKSGLASITATGAEVVATGSSSSAKLVIYCSGSGVTVTGTGIVVTATGLLLAPDAAQAGGGLVWYDTSGNAANITLPASGVSWNVPTSGKIAGNLTVNGGQIQMGGTNPYIQGTTGTGYIQFQNVGDVVVASNSGKLVLASNGTTNATLAASGNLLLGTTTDNGFGKLQSNGPISAVAASTHVLDLSGRSSDNLSSIRFSSNNAVTSYAQIFANSSGSFSVATGSGLTTALTLDSSQNATFAGFVTSGGGYIAKGTINIPSAAYASLESGSSVGYLTSYNGAGSAYLPMTYRASLHEFTQGPIAINNTVQTAVSVASTHKVTISIGGSTYYLLATNV